MSISHIKVIGMATKRENGRQLSYIGRVQESIAIKFVTICKRILFPILIAICLMLLALIYDDLFFKNYLVLSILGLFISTCVFGEVSFHRRLNKFPIVSSINNILIRWTIVIFILSSTGYLTELYPYFSRIVLIYWIMLTPCFLVIIHFFIWLFLSKLISTGLMRDAIIVGANETSYELFRRIDSSRHLNIRVKGFFDDRDINRLELDYRHKILGSIIGLSDYVKHNSIQVIYVCLPVVWQPRIVKLLEDLRDTTTSIYFVPDISGFDLIQPRIAQTVGIPMVVICDTPFYGYNELIKRTTDFILALIILLLIWPVMLGIAIGVKFTSPGPVLFKQRRYGLYGEEIFVYKFRTMLVCEDGLKITQATLNDARITPFGHFLRRTSLDELPQFINVVIGNMSIVGPRPHAVAHNELYRKLINGYMIRHKVKPGITGWAQVNGLRGETPTLDKMSMRVDYDLDYLRNWSLALDFWIIFRTIFLVLLGDHKAY